MEWTFFLAKHGLVDVKLPLLEVEEAQYLRSMNPDYVEEVEPEPEPRPPTGTFTHAFLSVADPDPRSKT